jgi:signal transduction histidine kinase
MEATVEAAIDYEFWMFWMAAANFIGTILLALYFFLTRRSNVNKTEIKELSDQLSKIDQRVLVVERDIQAMPSHQDLSNLYERVNSMSDDVSQMSGSLDALTRQLSLIHEHLLSQGSKK